MAQKTWTRDELLIAFNLYCRIPFGKLHKTNPEIISFAQKLGRTPSALSMKLCNFASFDPALSKRKVAGLTHVGRGDRQIWDEFNANWDSLAIESQKALSRIAGEEALIIRIDEPDLPEGPTESSRMTKIRLVQNFFRASVLSSYKFSCSFCNLSVPEMLCASHIIPWSKNTERRADPRNGICLCAFHDRAFDRGLVTIDNDLHIIISDRIRNGKSCPLHETGFIQMHGVRIKLPERFLPDAAAIQYHRDNIFNTT